MTTRHSTPPQCELTCVCGGLKARTSADLIRERSEILMSKQPTLTQLAEHTPDYQAFPGAHANIVHTVTPGMVNGAFQAGLYYIAADLSELARTAPPNKSEAIMAIVRLVRAVADN